MLLNKGMVMATKEYEGWFDRQLQKNNTGSYTVSVPINIIRALRWQQGQRVRITRRGNQVILTDAPPKRG